MSSAALSYWTADQCNKPLFSKLHGHLLVMQHVVKDQICLIKWLAGICLTRGKTKMGLILTAFWLVTWSHVAGSESICAILSAEGYFPSLLFHVSLGSLQPAARHPSHSQKCRCSGIKWTESELSACWLWCISNPQVNLAQPAEAIHNWIRGHDKVPGAWTAINGQVSFLEHTSQENTQGLDDWYRSYKNKNPTKTIKVL